MTHSVRDLQPDDVDALQELLESFPAYAERITGYPPGPSDALSALISVPPGFDPAGKRSIGLWDDRELVAFADVLLGYPDPETAYIGLLIVHGAHQGKGLGRRLHDAVLDRVREENSASRIRLGIVERNAEWATPFWTALGYEPTGETKPYRYDKLESTVSMWERQTAS
ncbi:ribosomal protein S18 acetylase RimI-like enzyme [Curtobacterium sp. PhB130]|uniref:GNAT family N-acetyltransferase n=1 Tax=Curtobacterium sp. PhB130 TaxID=2485178 RepID=UPI000F9C9D81|nr:GNAT family N-acetyltransferase [Curtobacterium sp. PhB130]ROS72179.1 ribosomal protein S18 acetylase RimI-like enzyme [Curtobacterium sp. PhB130]